VIAAVVVLTTAPGYLSKESFHYYKSVAFSRISSDERRKRDLYMQRKTCRKTCPLCRRDFVEQAEVIEFQGRIGTFVELVHQPEGRGTEKRFVPHKIMGYHKRSDTFFEHIIMVTCPE